MRTTRPFFLLAALSLGGCVIDSKDGSDSGDSADFSDSGDSGDTDNVDADADGYTTADDCNDADASINPGATEICDGVDNNCDGETDEGLLTPVYADLDGDGFGAGAAVGGVCDASSLPEGQVLDSTDCDDSDSSVNPGATELCDGLDNDCDAATSEPDGVTIWTPTEVLDATWWADGTASVPQALHTEDAYTIAVCGGPYYVNFGVSHDLTLFNGDPARPAILSGGGVKPVLLTTEGSSGVDVQISDITIEDGLGSGGYMDDGGYYGGGVSCGTDNTLILDRVTIQDSKASVGAGYAGGGVLLVDCAATITDSIITGNGTVGDYGGGIAAIGDNVMLELIDSEVTDNEATIGAGVVISGESESSAALAILQGTLVDGNEALTFAGGAYVSYASLSCEDTKTYYGAFTDNSVTAGNGGAIGVAPTFVSPQTVTSAGCDFGTSAGRDNNSPNDVQLNGPSYSYGDDATFTCTPSGCK